MSFVNKKRRQQIKKNKIRPVKEGFAGILSPLITIIGKHRLQFIFALYYVVDDICNLALKILLFIIQFEVSKVVSSNRV